MLLYDHQSIMHAQIWHKSKNYARISPPAAFLVARKAVSKTFYLEKIMSNALQLNATKRTDLGKGASRRLRRTVQGVPAVIYGAEKEAISILLEHRKVVKALENEDFYTQIIDLDVEGSTEQVVVKDIQRHPFKPLIMHMDFVRIKAGKKMTTHAPLHFIGEDKAPGVKSSGGIVTHLITDIEITCLPNDLPKFIEIDVSNLELDEVLHLSDITLPKGLAFTALATETPNDLAIVSIHKPRGAAQMDDQEIPEQERDESDSEDKGKGKGK